MGYNSCPRLGEDDAGGFLSNDRAMRRERREKAKRARRAKVKRAHRRGDQGGRIKPR